MSEKHPSWREILEFVEPGPSRGRSLEPHLRSCSSCSRLAESARELLGLFAEARLPDPPRHLVEATVTRILDELRGRSAEQPAGSLASDFVERAAQQVKDLAGAVWASLVTDSLTANHAVRGSGESRARMLLYETEEVSIAVSLRPGSTSDRRDVRGQVTPKREGTLPPGGTARVAAAGKEIEAELSEFGEFTAADVPAGELLLTIGLGGQRISLRVDPEGAGD